MSTEMRIYIDKFKDFFENRKAVEVIISYDCSDIHNSFREKLLEFLKSDYCIEEITMSNYKIGKMLTIQEIEKLKLEIIKLFKDSTIVSEGQKEKRTIVTLITPIDSQFVIDEIINENVK